MANQAMPHDGLERLAVRRHRFGIHGRDDHTRVGNLRGVASVASDDAGFMTGSGMVVDGGLNAQ